MVVEAVCKDFQNKWVKFGLSEKFINKKKFWNKTKHSFEHLVIVGHDRMHCLKLKRNWLICLFCSLCFGILLLSPSNGFYLKFYILAQNCEESSYKCHRSITGIVFKKIVIRFHIDLILN